MVAADARTAITFSLSPGQAHDAPAGRQLLNRLGSTGRAIHLIMDRAYSDNETRQLALNLGFAPVVPPKTDRIEPWEYNRVMYRRRNEIERLFRRLKGFRRIFSRFEKLDVMFVAFIHFALIIEAMRSVNTP
jgi:transposase